MNITLDDFKAHIGTSGLHKAGIHAIPRALGIVTKYYCDNLTLRSACSENCAQCILALKARLEKTTWEGSRPYALFTFTVKNTAAGAVEVKQEPNAAPKKPALFQAEEEKDALDLFMEMLNAD